MANSARRSLMDQIRVVTDCYPQHIVDGAGQYTESEEFCEHLYRALDDLIDKLEPAASQEPV